MANFELLQQTGLYDQQEICSLFDLKLTDLPASLLHFQSGPSLLNRQRSELGYDALSVDHHYGDDVQHWQASILDMLSNADAAEADIVLLQQRCEDFFSDYRDGLAQGRYQNVSLKQLLNQQLSFGMALCLLGEDDFSSVEDMLECLNLLQQLAHEVRVFPIASQGNNVENILGPLLIELQSRDCGIELKHSPHAIESQQEAAVLRIWTRTCGVST